ncbi:hypothetical protein PV04_04653 [Phialophora macrospora]|uniref:Uncharacterized protein n=1 Tax=Phialophora macrospora TaxID=1851006 RepID=A0A0D2G9U7_9EURO|nr:hypothetical protein PV04_04653 [Phialophora macrospora]
MSRSSKASLSRSDILASLAAQQDEEAQHSAQTVLLGDRESVCMFTKHRQSANLPYPIDPNTKTPERYPNKPVYPPLVENPTPDQASIWATLKSDYDAKMKIYQKTMQAIGTIGNVLNATMNPNYQVFFEEEGIVTLYDRMVTLKKHIAPDDRNVM